jgi:prolipoprotein diacylglyceryltransferase
VVTAGPLLAARGPARALAPRRVLFRWRGVTVHSYPALAYLGMVLGMVAQNVAANAAGLDSLRVYGATLILLPVALAGARALFVATHWETYRRDPARIGRRSDGGMAMYGAVPAMLLASIPLLAALGVPFWAYWDVSSFCVLVGMAFTRTGCLLNGCCGGRLAAGASFPGGPAAADRRLPTQLLEIAWSLLLLLGAVAAWPWRPYPGALFLATLAGYAVGRLLLQRTREHRQRVGGVELPLVLSAALIACALAASLAIRP